MEWPDKSVPTPPYLQSRQKAGAGCGTGKTFKTWTSFRRRGGHGSDRLFRCILTGRQVDLPSTAHDAYFFLRERRPATVSVEEGFPLMDVRESLAACAEASIAHPMHKGFPEPLTLDFLIRERAEDGQMRLHGRTLSTTPADAAAAGLLRVTHAICLSHDIDWKLVDPTPLTSTLASSLRFARAWSVERFQPGPDREREMAAMFIGSYRPSLTLKEFIDSVAAPLKCSTSEALLRFRYAAWYGAIPVDFTHELRLDKPVHLLGAY